MKPITALLVAIVLLTGCGRPHDRSWGTSQARNMVDVDLAPSEQTKRDSRAERVTP